MGPTVDQFQQFIQELTRAYCSQFEHLIQELAGAYLKHVPVFDSECCWEPTVRLSQHLAPEDHTQPQPE